MNRTNPATPIGVTRTHESDPVERWEDEGGACASSPVTPNGAAVGNGWGMPSFGAVQPRLGARPDPARLPAGRSTVQRVAAAER